MASVGGWELHSKLEEVSPYVWRFFTRVDGRAPWQSWFDLRADNAEDARREMQGILVNLGCVANLKPWAGPTQMDSAL